MNTSTALLVLLLAAVLEAGGDFVVRLALGTSSLLARTLLFAAGALVLFLYGVVVNVPHWDFGRLLGVYVVFFFVVAQVISSLRSASLPPASILVGGALIVAGGAVITFWGT